MPTSSKKRTRTAARRPRPKAKATKGLRCPDCDFVAKHPMGLGRHRSSRHGVVSQRQARREAEGGWVTRQEAARRAGVHYNTIRHWERAGKLRTARRAGHRGAMINASDLQRAASGTPPRSDDARIDALEERFNELVAGLESLVAAARRPSRRRARK